MFIRLATSDGFWFSPLRALDAVCFSSQTTAARPSEQSLVWMGRFSRAGWLGGPRRPRSARVSGSTAQAPSTTSVKAQGLRVQKCAKGLRISGRVQDVCAELERLALQEIAQDTRALRN